MGFQPVYRSLWEMVEEQSRDRLRLEHLLRTNQSPPLLHTIYNSFAPSAVHNGWVKAHQIVRTLIHM